MSAHFAGSHGAAARSGCGGSRTAAGAETADGGQARDGGRRTATDGGRRSADGRSSGRRLRASAGARHPQLPGAPAVPTPPAPAPPPAPGAIQLLDFLLGLMRSRRDRNSLVSSPILVGAVTTLVAVIAVFLSYNANAGLPFVPTYEVTVEVQDAAGLVEGNEVAHRRQARRRRRGDRRRRRSPKGPPIAELTLKLDLTAKPLRDDTSVTVRPRSTLGLKYLELTPGRRGQATIPDGGRLALAQSQSGRRPRRGRQHLRRVDPPGRPGSRSASSGPGRPAAASTSTRRWPSRRSLFTRARAGAGQPRRPAHAASGALIPALERVAVRGRARLAAARHA